MQNPVNFINMKFTGLSKTNQSCYPSLLLLVQVLNTFLLGLCISCEGGLQLIVIMMTNSRSREWD